MSSTVNWLNVTPSLQRGLDVINKIDSKKFLLVLKRIAQTMQASRDEMRPFSEEEEEKLLVTLSINRTELNLLLDSSTLIITQAAYHITKPAILHRQLVESLKLEEEKAQAFVHIWTNHAKLVVNKLRQKSIHPVQLEGISWQLNLTTSIDTEGQQLEPRAVIELKLKHDNDKTGNTVLDLDKEGLVSLYNTLERIQTELDSLR